MDTVIIYIHGFGSSPMGRKSLFLSEVCIKNGLAFTAADLTPTQEDFTNMNVAYLLKRIDKLVKKHSDNQIILVGSSMGGYLSILSCRIHCNIKGMILLAPAVGISDLKAYSDKELENWRKNGSKKFFLKKFGKEVDLSFKFITSILDSPTKDVILNDIPILIFHGKNDTIVQVDDVKAFSERQINSILHILDSDHKLHDQFPFIEEKIIEFIKANFN